MDREEFARQFIERARQQGLPEEQIRVGLGNALQEFDSKTQQPKGGLLQSKALPIGGSLLGGVIGGFAGPATGIAGAGAGYAGGDVIRKNLMGLLGMPQEKTGVESVAETAKGAGTMAGLEALGIGVGKLAGKGLGMIPTKAKLGQKQLEAATKFTGELDITKMIEAGDAYVENIPIAKKLWEATWKPSIKKMGKKTALEMVQRLKEYGPLTYTATGDVRAKAESGLLNAIYHAGRSVLKEQAPEVAKYTPQIKQLYDLPKDIQKATWLSSKIGFTANMLKNLLGL